MTHLYKIGVKGVQSKNRNNRNIGGRLRFTLAPAKYKNTTKGQEREIHRNADWATLWEGKTASELGTYIQSIQGHNPVCLSVCLWYLGSCN